MIWKTIYYRGAIPRCKINAKQFPTIPNNSIQCLKKINDIKLISNEFPSEFKPINEPHHVYLFRRQSLITDKPISNESWICMY